MCVCVVCVHACLCVGAKRGVRDAEKKKQKYAHIQIHKKLEPPTLSYYSSFKFHLYFIRKKLHIFIADLLR